MSCVSRDGVNTFRVGTVPCGSWLASEGGLTAPPIVFLMYPFITAITAVYMLISAVGRLGIIYI